MKILVTPTSFKPDSETPAMKKLKAFAGSLVFNPVGKPLSEDELIPLLEGCEGCIAGLDYYTPRVLESAKTLKVISRYGVGVDRVDLAAAKAQNIVVCNTPGANNQAVADLAFALLLSTARRVPVLDRKTKDGQWPRSTGTELYGKTIGIMGLGAIGKAVAKRAAGFSMNVIAYDPFINREYAQANGIVQADFDTVIREADFLSLHLPLTEETRHVISADVMRSMKKGAIIVNTARGGLIDEAAACQFLASGHLGGMGLDVYEEEPPQKSPLFELENVVLTPHTSAHTTEATEAMADMSVQNLIEVLSGKDCRNII
ncbi:MAG: phosphoglycerate dehydrogenase [Treponema sp.]|nr:phosphoglycerate dehydrogenase [Treponema sp.]MCL2233319.1 phosphoglycerate dehydrogenase [Treponema sp.]